MTLPYDYARCLGWHDADPVPNITRSECLWCQRRTSPPRDDYGSWMARPTFTDQGICPERIAP